MDVKLQKQSSRQLVQPLGLSAVWLVRICSHLSSLKKLIAFRSCGHLMSNYCWHLMLPYHCSIFGYIRIASNKGTTITKRYHAAVNEISGLFFSFVCVVCFYFWMLLFQAQLDVRIKPQSILYAFCCNVLVRMDIAWYCRSVAWMVRGW